MVRYLAELGGVRLAVDMVKQRLVRLTATDEVVDVAFIGNASSLYEWVPTRVADVDCLLFVRELSPSVGRLLDDQRSSIRARLAELAIDFELRIIETLPARSIDRRSANRVCSSRCLYG